MRGGWGLVLVLLSGLVGCMSSPPVRPLAWLDRYRPAAGPVGPDVVQIEVAVLERPAGDPYLNHDLWDQLDEQVVPPEQKAILEDNGLRVGQIGGIPPAELQGLLTSERSYRVNPRHLELRAGNTGTVVLGPQLPLCRFDLAQDGGLTQVTLERARCLFSVVPALTADGRVRLRLTPVVRHGEATMLFRPVADDAGGRKWDFQEVQPQEHYARLAWEVTLAPNEYVVVGTRHDRDRTLGHASFVGEEGTKPVQRLLVIRTGRPPRMLAAEFPGEENGKLGRALPLALQAHVTAASQGERGP